ncbi:MAG: PleD family two-component system response regulator [Cyanobacteria bacterium P01_H01_bin.121]
MAISLESNSLPLLERTPQVMIVDDERMARMVLRRAMEREGYQIHEAKNGEECLQYCQAQELPDLILIDALMPFMDGFTCCKRLKEVFEDNCPPILMVTTLNDPESINDAFQSGATDFITKPIHWAVLRQRVRRVMMAHWAMQKLRRLVYQDGLTQLANRRHFDDCLQQEWRRMLREGWPLSIILCDVDFFKAYNDTYGHQAGDDCLRQVAALIQQSIQHSTDLAARYGGEEFVLLLPNTDLERALDTASMLRKRVRDEAIVHAGSPVAAYVTLSFGIAIAYADHTDLASPEDLLRQADQALYHAKAKGRDSICHTYTGNLHELNTSLSQTLQNARTYKIFTWDDGSVSRVV